MLTYVQTVSYRALLVPPHRTQQPYSTGILHRPGYTGGSQDSDTRNILWVFGSLLKNFNCSLTVNNAPTTRCVPTIYLGNKFDTSSSHATALPAYLPTNLHSTLSHNCPITYWHTTLTVPITLVNKILAHERFIVFLTYLFTLNPNMQSKFFHHPQFLYNGLLKYWFFGIFGIFISDCFIHE